MSRQNWIVNELELDRDWVFNYIRMKGQERYYHYYGHDVYGYGIVQDEMDYLRLLYDLKELSGNHNKLIAYCLIPDHCHILIRSDVESGPPDIACAGFIGWVRSPAIYNREFARKLVTYIHRLPVQLGLSSNLQKWRFSSFNDIHYQKSWVIDVPYAIGLFGDHNHFVDMHQQTLMDLHMEWPDFRV